MGVPQRVARGLSAGAWSLLLFMAVAAGASSLMLPPQPDLRFGALERALLLGLLLLSAAGSLGLLALARGRRNGVMTRLVKLARAGSWVLAFAVVDCGLALAVGDGPRVWSIAASFGGIALLVMGAPRPSEFDLFDRR